MYKEYFYLFLIYSFLGWIMEIIYAFIKSKYFINRGFLLGPLCPIYGFGALLIIIFNKIFYNSNIFYVFLNSIILTSFIEYITGYILEYFFKTTWWDYTNEKYNIKGRICLKFSMLWGVISLLILYVISPLLFKIISKLNNTFIYKYSYILILILFIDITYSIYEATQFKKSMIILCKIRIEIQNKVRKDLDKIHILKSRHNRILKAFPNIKIDSKNINVILKNIIKMNKQVK